MGASQPRPPLSIADCPICSRLAEIETSFYKYGWEEQDRPLPAEAARLEAIGPTASYDEQREHVRRCPVCGTFYHYRLTYEYHVNGSEDEERLTRLTPTQARPFLTDEEYDALIAALAGALQAASPQARVYAAKCLASHDAARGDVPAIAELLRRADPEARRGALLFLSQLAEEGGDLRGLAGVLAELSADADANVASAARLVLSR